jgi:hypothetical protein
MSQAGFELGILASEQQQTHALDSASIRIGQKPGNCTKRLSLTRILQKNNYVILFAIPG